MGLGTLEKVGLAIAGAYLGSYFFPETFYTATSGLLGTSPAGSTGLLQPAALQSTTALSGGAEGIGFAPGSVATPDFTESVVQGSTFTPPPAAQTDTSFLGDLQEGFTSPTALQGLLVAGASLGSSLLATSEKGKDRKSREAESERGREFSREENEVTREFNAAEAAKTREFQAGQAESNREFRAEQERKSREFQAIIAAQNARSSLVNQRLGGGTQRGGRSLSQGAANINTALLAG